MTDKAVTSSSRASLALAFFLATGGTAAVGVVAALSYYERRRQRQRRGRAGNNASRREITSSSSYAYEKLIGETPLVLLENVSNLIRRRIYVKMESLNPGGTCKDRAAMGMIRAAELNGDLPPPLASSSNFQQPVCSDLMLMEVHDDKQQQKSAAATTNGSSSSSSSIPSDRKRNSKEAITDMAIDNAIKESMAHSRTGGLIVEGTSGSTGISLANLSRCCGHGIIVVIPDDQAVEKQSILKALGATVFRVPTASISNPNHYVNAARKIAHRAKNTHGIKAAFINQFENPANYDIHYAQTGPEIYEQCGRQVSAFVMSAGTGGTISGVSRYLKERTGGRRSSQPPCLTVLVDPPGSSLYNKIQHGVAYASEQRERTLKRHRYDTIAEGIGLDRVTRNLSLGIDYIDEAIQVTDQEALDMAHWLLQTEGLWVGSSSAMNVVGAVRTAIKLPEGSKVVTVVCDGGQRHLTRFWNRDFCISWGLQWPGDLPEHERIPDCTKEAIKSHQ